MRKKILYSEKKKKVSASINPEIYNLMIQYMKDNDINNKSKFINDILKKELKIYEIC